MASRRPYPVPGFLLRLGNSAASAASRVRCNVHQRNLVVARAFTFPPHSMPVFIDESPGKRKTVDRAFRSGLRAVVGATGLAYGAHLTRGMSGSSRYMENADFLAAAFFDGIRESFGAGEAFQNARQRLVANIRRRRPDRDGTGDLWLSRYEIKTLLQFQLFGDPTA